MIQVLINNQWVDEKEAMVNLFSDAVMYGAGVFETLRTTNRRRIFRLKDHIERLYSSATKIGLPLKYTEEEIRSMVNKITRSSPFDLQRIKIIVTPEDCIVISSELAIDPSIYEGVSVMSVIQQRALPSVKSLSYLECYLSYQKAQKSGFFEAILINEKGEVYEGSRSNLFWFEGNQLCTRRGEVLPGITRRTILELSPFPIKYKTITIGNLKNRQEIFQTGSVVGVVPVVKIDEVQIGNGSPGVKTREIMRLYKKLMN